MKKSEKKDVRVREELRSKKKSKRKKGVHVSLSMRSVRHEGGRTILGPRIPLGDTYMGQPGTKKTKTKQPKVEINRRVAVESSMIKSLGYDAKATTMDVEFNGGSVYRYKDVPAALYVEILNSESVGEAFSANVKKYPARYPYTKVKGGK